LKKDEAVTLQHVAVRVVGDGKEMWRHLCSTFSLVLVNDAQRVDGDAPIRVDDDAEQA